MKGGAEFGLTKPSRGQSVTKSSQSHHLHLGLSCLNDETHCTSLQPHRILQDTMASPFASTSRAMMSGRSGAGAFAAAAWQRPSAALAVPAPAAGVLSARPRASAVSAAPSSARFLSTSRTHQKAAQNPVTGPSAADTDKATAASLSWSECECRSGFIIGSAERCRWGSQVLTPPSDVPTDLKMRKSRRLAGMVTSLPTTLLAAVGSGSYFLTQDLDPTNLIAGIDPVYVSVAAVLGCTGE